MKETSIGLLLFLLGCVSCQSGLYFVNLPNIIRVDTSESASIFVENVKGEIKIQLTVKDQADKELWKAEGSCAEGKPGNIEIQIKSSQLPPKSEDQVNEYVKITATSVSGLNFVRSANIPISRKARNVYIQTDKPIYTPQQTVRFRIIPVNLLLKPAIATGITVEIRNPDGKITRRWGKLLSSKGYIAKDFTLGDTPLFGNWTISAFYANQNSSVEFEVREYVLPRFSVRIVGPPYVLETDNTIKITVFASYVYGKAVKGRAVLKIGILNDRDEVVDITEIRDTLLNGKIEFVLPVRTIKDHSSNIWFPDGDRLNLHASVTEKASGHVERTVDTSVFCSSTPYKITFKKSLKFFKPGLPYDVKVNVKYPNKRPAASADVVIHGTVTKTNKAKYVVTDYRGSGLSLRTDKEGNGQVTLDIPRDAVDLVVEAKHIHVQGKKKAVMKAIPVDSKTGSYIVIRTPPQKLKVGEIAEFQIMVHPKIVKTLSYMVLARGQIQLQRTLTNPGIVTVIRFRVTVSMCPVMRIVSFYTVPDGTATQTVADQVAVDVGNKFRHEVTIKTKQNIYKPGNKSKLVIKGTPNSNAAILAVDKSIYLLRNDHRLSKSVVFDKLKRFDSGCGHGGGKSAEAVFKNSGITLLTNANVKPLITTGLRCRPDDDGPKRKRRSAEEERACCERGKRARLSSKSCRNQKEALKENELCIKSFMKCCRGDRGRSIANEDIDEDEIIEDDRQVQFRSNFPETWLFGDVNIGSSGVTEMDVVVPDTITTWVLQAFATNEDSGLGVADSFEMIAFKPFFIQLNLPYSAFRGERMMLTATIFNYAKKRISSSVYLQASDGICYVKGKGEKSRRQIVRVKGNDALTLQFPVIPTDLGKSNVTVIAYTANGGDAVTRELRVEPEGIEKEIIVSKQIDPSAGTLASQTIIFNVDVPKDAVPGSESATMFLTGDLLGPLLTKLLHNAKQALRNPVEVYQVSSTETFTVTVTQQQFFQTFSPSCVCNVLSAGCRRSVNVRTRTVLRTRTRTVWRQRDRFLMESIAPNVYVLRYLKKIGKTDLKRGQEFIAESYRRLLGHRTKDGSFSMWGNTMGTLWLTAFVMKNLNDASEFITVDKTVICQAMRFIMKSQKVSGAFLSEGETFSKGMMGGLNGDPAMTAFVLIALKKTLCPQLTMSVYSVTSKAETYLRSRLESTKASYDLALMSYAFALCNNNDAHKSLEKLVKNGIFNKVDKTLHWDSGSEAVTVETTAYALLAFLELNKLTYVKPIIKWLTEHKNAQGGFSSGQDTAVALEALSKYASVPAQLFLRISVMSTSEPTFKESRVIRKSNALVQQSFEVPVGGQLQLTARGIGIAEAQVEVMYNIPKPPRVCEFQIEIDLLEHDEKQSSYSIDVKACVRYKGSGNVGMSVIEMGILTGFVPVKESLAKMLNQSIISRYELGDRMTVLYFQKIDKIKSTCVTVTFLRVFDVEALQPAVVTVRDFLSQEISCTQMYSLSSKSVAFNRVCKDGKCKCAQRRCPPCRPRRIREHFCSRDYAAKIAVVSVLKESKWTNIIARVKEVYKDSAYMPLNEKIELWIDKECRCPALRKGRKYLVMGYGGRKLVLTETSFIKRFPNKKKSPKEYEKVVNRLMEPCN